MMNNMMGGQSPTNRLNFGMRQPSGIGYNPNQSMGGSISGPSMNGPGMNGGMQGLGMNNPMPMLPKPQISYPGSANMGGLSGGNNTPYQPYTGPNLANPQPPAGGGITGGLNFDSMGNVTGSVGQNPYNPKNPNIGTYTGFPGIGMGQPMGQPSLGSSGEDFGGDGGSLMNQIRLMYPGAFSG